MQDIPMFTTENGVASLTLREITYTKKAYIRIQASQDPEKLLKECKDFCVMVGASDIYASGIPNDTQYSYFTSIIQMRCLRFNLPESDLSLFPVTDKTVDRWREIYNEKAQKVPNAAYLTKADTSKILNTGAAYFVHRNKELQGIGWIQDNQILWISACRPGAGKEVLCALAGAISGERVTLEVAATNEKAVRMYESLGFVATKELSRWYQL